MAEINEVVARMVEIRDRMNTRQKAFEQGQKRDRKLWERGEQWLMQKLEEQGISNVATETHSVFCNDSLRASCGDWNALSEFITKTGNVDLLEHRVSSKSVKQYMEDNDGELPPGVKTFTQRKINIRRKS